MPDESLSITDNRTGKQYELAVSDGTIRAIELRQIKMSEDDFGLMAYDPSFLNTASCRSTITYIDGDKGILRYRGYPIEQLVGEYSHLEVAYLLLYGELPNEVEFRQWSDDIRKHIELPPAVLQLIRSFPPGGFPMAMLATAVASLSNFYPEGRTVLDPQVRLLQIHRLLAQVPALSAQVFRRLQGLPPTQPARGLSYAGTFLQMAFDRVPEPVVEKAMDALFILHADHEQNCSASAMRSVASSHPDPYSAAAAAIAALYGPLHGGANEAVLEMLADIGSIDKIPQYIERAKKGEFRLMGFGHRVYKAYDPRAAIIKDIAHDVFEVTGKNPLLDIALELERIALEDDYFVRRRLYPNVDFYSGLIYQSIGLPTSMFTVLFAIARMSGWLAQWLEMLNDPETRIARPRQVYLGEDNRKYVAMSRRRKK
jgi:citrate synthase